MVYLRRLKPNIIRTLRDFREDNINSQVLSDLKKLVNEKLGPKAPKSFFSQYIKVLTEPHKKFNDLRPGSETIEGLDKNTSYKQMQNRKHKKCTDNDTRF